MTERIYTDGEMNEAKRLVNTITSIPDKEKQSAFIRIIEAMLLGAELAGRFGNQPMM